MIYIGNKQWEEEKVTVMWPHIEDGLVVLEDEQGNYFIVSGNMAQYGKEYWDMTLVDEIIGVTQ